jgi:amino acid transporter
LFAGLCYAEFAARVPKAGSAYVYSYVSVGEIVAYVIGWNLILEYAIGTASVARGLSGYIDALAEHKIQAGMESWARMHVDFLATYPDFLAFGFVMLLTGYCHPLTSILSNISTRFKKKTMLFKILVVYLFINSFVFRGLLFTLQFTLQFLRYFLYRSQFQLD